MITIRYGHACDNTCGEEVPAKFVTRRIPYPVKIFTVTGNYQNQQL
ncbi:hypothetical protein [Agriterribacter sp.]|nr:hypothetical protein [Agriterribacter sp.]HRP57959.1 hypothetical protein [Agriterribacter sp.]